MATIQLPPDFKEFLKLLNSNSIHYYTAELDGVTVHLIELGDLKLNKQASGRLKDQLDLEQLS